MPQFRSWRASVRRDSPVGLSASLDRIISSSSSSSTPGRRSRRSHGLTRDYSGNSDNVNSGDFCRPVYPFAEFSAGKVIADGVPARISRTESGALACAAAPNTRCGPRRRKEETHGGEVAIKETAIKRQCERLQAATRQGLPRGKHSATRRRNAKEDPSVVGSVCWPRKGPRTPSLPRETNLSKPRFGDPDQPAETRTPVVAVFLSVIRNEEMR